MIHQSDAQRSLAVYRYAILITAFNAFIICLMSPVILTSNPNIRANITFADTLIPAIFVAIVTAIIGVASYFIYAQLLQKAVGKPKQSFSVS